MPDLQPFRDAATIHVEASPDQVVELLTRPGILKALDDRVPDDRPLDIVHEDDRVEARDLDGHLHLTFRATPEERGTRLSAQETVRPVDALEATKHLFFPGRHHKELQGELRRLKALIEGL